MSQSVGGGTVLWECDARGVGTVTLNRPDVNNAYSGDLIRGLHGAMDALGARDGLRVVVLTGRGTHFQAGADLKWAPGVTRATKLRALSVAGALVDDAALRELILEHAATRQRDEAAEGLASFAEKRPPAWYPDSPRR